MPVNPIFEDMLVVIKGGGDLASGVAYRLKRAGFPVLLTELETPLMVRRTVCYGNAVYEGEVRVEDITARRVDRPAEARRLALTEVIPVLVAPEPAMLVALKPHVLVDAIMAKANTGTAITAAPLVVALGPGFTAGQDCHVVIETNRGHWLGRVIYRGSAEPDTQVPGSMQGHTVDRILRAPAAGRVAAAAGIGDRLKAGQLIATVAGHEVRAPFEGVLRGLVHPAVAVTPGFKIGDLDPRGEVRHCFTLSDKSLAVGGGVLEAILSSNVVPGKRR
ncbi:MAG: selenium-dependent molybdenum cofactor biosynthesis protein YqeB [Chloroflexota bacterium]